MWFHIVSENEAPATRLCSSTRQFPIYSTFVLVMVRPYCRRLSVVTRRHFDASVDETLVYILLIFSLSPVHTGD